MGQNGLILIIFRIQREDNAADELRLGSEFLGVQRRTCSPIGVYVSVLGVLQPFEFKV